MRLYPETLPFFEAVILWLTVTNFYDKGKSYLPALKSALVAFFGSGQLRE